MKFSRQALLHRLDAPALPEKTVPPARAEIRDAHRPFAAEDAQPLDLRPQLGLGAGVEHVEVEAAHEAHRRSRAQFVDDGERGNLPHRGLGPGPFEAQFILAVAPDRARIRAAGSWRAIP